MIMLIILDEQGRAPLLPLTAPGSGRLYLGEVAADGTIMLTPARAVPATPSTAEEGSAPLRCRLSGQVAEDYAAVVHAMSARWNRDLAPAEAAEHDMGEQEWWHDADHARHLWSAYVQALTALAVQAGQYGPTSIPPIDGGATTDA
jgi:hypothetical protein